MRPDNSAQIGVPSGSHPSLTGDRKSETIVATEERTCTFCAKQSIRIGDIEKPSVRHVFGL